MAYTNASFEAATLGTLRWPHHLGFTPLVLLGSPCLPWELTALSYNRLLKPLSGSCVERSPELGPGAEEVGFSPSLFPPALVCEQRQVL